MIKMYKAVTICLFLLSIGHTTTIESVIQKSDPKVVKIGIVGEKGQGVCSGSFIDSQGLVLTCAHCFEHSNIKKIFIKTSDEKVYKGDILSIDKEKDLALVKLEENGEEFKYFEFGSMPVKGQQVLSFGSPGGLQGIDSVGYVETLIKEKHVFIVHSAFINPGSSGSPLVDLEGLLIGVNEAVYMENILVPAQGLFSAIDSSTVREFLAERGY